MRIAAAAVALILLLLLAGFTYEQIGRATDARNLPPRIGRAINVGGRTINLFCSGQGTPTVILEAGGNEPGYSWASVQSKIAEFTTACWYDRAGVGWSDPPLAPRNSTSVVTDLHLALQRAGVLPPYVFVGASIGAEYARIYTARYPADVAGLVFADATHPDQQEPAFMLGMSSRLPQRTRQALCLALPALARFGILRFVAHRMGGPLPFPSDPQNDTSMKLATQPKSLLVNAEQACTATDGGRITPRSGSGNPDLDGAARNAGRLGDRPLIVLTAGEFWAPPGLEKEAAEFHDRWVHELQASLAQLSTRGQQVIVDAHHDMSEAPEVVVSATKQVVEAVRKTRP